MAIDFNSTALGVLFQKYDNTVMNVILMNHSTFSFADDIIQKIKGYIAQPHHKERQSKWKYKSH